MGPEQILNFWFNEVGPDRWYDSDPVLDAEISRRFGSMWDDAALGACGLWLTSANGTLAYIILTDQFPRNMFRGQSKAFETDKSARAAAKIAISRDWDMAISAQGREFFYTPLLHSENLVDQDRCVRLMLTRLPGADSNLLHARVHREIVRRFGRFPYRNEALGRVSTEAEAKFLQDGGYGRILRQLQAEQLAA